MADLKISQLPPMTAGDLASDDVLAITDVSASETKKITAKDLVEEGVVLIDDASIPAAKIAAGGSSLGNTTAAAQFLAGPTAAAGAIAARVIVSGDLPVATSFVTGVVKPGQGLSLDSAGTLAVFPAGTSAGVLGGTYIPLGSGLSISSAGAVNHADSIVAQTTNGVTVNATGHVTALGSIQPFELPIATTTAVGVVSVGSGLSVTAAGQLNHTDVVGAGTSAGISYNNTGHITSVAGIGPTDLPVATNAAIGAVSVPGPELQVTAAGAIGLQTTGVVAGIYPKVTVNQYGRVTDGELLAANDIPNIPATKIVGGTLSPGVIGDKSITRQMLADYSISYIQEGQPTNTNPGSIGCLWFQESTAQLRMWNGNSWMSVGFGRLAADNLRWGGTIDASTGDVTGVTPAGITAGLSIGNALPSATDTLGGLYLVVDTAGSSIAVTSGISYDAGDWCLCISANTGWVRIDTMTGGGGGGASTLGQLLDVTLTNPTQGDILVYGTNALWENSDTLSGGTY